MTINIFDAIYACMQSQEKSKDIWENCLNIIKSRLTRKEMNFYFQIDRVFDKLKIHDYLHLLYERYSLVDKWFGITNLISLIGHCEKEIQIGTYDKTKSEYLQVPENLRSHIEGKIYTSYYEVLDSQIDKILETFLDLNNQENQFWEEFENRVNDAFEVELSDEIFRTIQISLPLETDTISTPRKPINLSEEQMRDCNIREYKVAPKYQSTMVIEIPGTDSRKKSRYIQIHGESRKIGDSLFPLLLVFVIELKKGEGDWIHLEDLAKKKKVIGNDAEYQKVGRLRDVLGVNLLENDGSGNYRISTHPDFVGYNKKKLLTSRDEWISDLANELP